MFYNMKMIVLGMFYNVKIVVLGYTIHTNVCFTKTLSFIISLPLHEQRWYIADLL